MIFAEPQADLRAAAGDRSSSPVPTSRPGFDDAVHGRAAPRASLIPLAKSVRRNRTLKVMLGSSVDAEGDAERSARPSSTLTLEAGATPFSFKVPANAKQGKQKLVLTVGAAHEERDVKVI